jgi:hypothetical protein
MLEPVDAVGAALAVSAYRAGYEWRRLVCSGKNRDGAAATCTQAWMLLGNA